MKILAFGHISNVGKDTAIRFLTNYLCLNTKLTIKKRGFSSWPKQKIYEAYAWAGVKDEAYYDEHRSEKYTPLLGLGKTPNQLYIEFCAALVSMNIETLEKVLLSTNHKCDLLLINDLRRPSEMGAVHRAGGLCIRVDSPLGTINSILDEQLIGNSGFDYVIDNSKDLNHLHSQMVELTKKVLND